MPIPKPYAVLTGDIVGSSLFRGRKRAPLLSELGRIFRLLDEIFPNNVVAPFAVFRGDSFQGVLSQPASALRAAILIRSNLRGAFENLRQSEIPDARIAVGIGPVDFLPKKSSEGDGEAYRLSGPSLDRMKGKRRLVIKTTLPEVDEELDTECALLDALMGRWSREQSEAISGQIQGFTQQEAALKFDISQPAVRQRLKIAGGWAVENFCSRFERLIRDRITPETNKRDK